MNNKERKIRSLTWKYFWKRKREEIYKWLKDWWMCLIPIIMFSLMIIAIIFPESGEIIFLIVVGTFGVIILFGLCYSIYSMIKAIIEWLCLNWKWATQDAIRELKKEVK